MDPALILPNHIIPVSYTAKIILPVNINEFFFFFLSQVSMVSQYLLNYVSLRLNQILQPNNRNATFGNISVLAFGDFYQLPPVLGTSLLADDSASLTNNIWMEFEKHKLEEVMRQKEDKQFAQLLNRLRVKEKKQPITPQDHLILSTAFKDPQTPSQSNHIHVFGTNKEVDAYNQAILNTFEDKIVLTACDVTQTMGGKIYHEKTPLSFRPSEGCMLQERLTLSINCRIMVTANVDVTGISFYIAIIFQYPYTVC